MSKLEHWRKLIDQGKDKRSQEMGRREVLMKRLKDEYQHDTVEDLEKEIEEVKAELEAKRQLLQTKEVEFENEFAARLERAAQ